MSCGTVLQTGLCEGRHSMKMTVFWDVAPCSLADADRCFKGDYCLQHRPDEGGSKRLRNVGQFLPDYTVQHPRRQSCTC
jgi:hypothetical protein